jgi:cobalt-zinc-cadmium resistance protein CzcA
LKAQSQQYLTESEAIDLALQQNRSIKALEQRTDAQRLLEKTAVELGNLSLMGTFGQYNSFASNDNNFTISQSIPFPTLFKAKKDWLESQTSMALQEQDLGKLQLSHQVRMAWNDLAYLHALNEWYAAHDSLLQEFARVAKARLDAGEANLLELVSAESTKAQFLNEWHMHRGKIASAEMGLQALLLSPVPVKIKYEGFQERSADYPALHLDSATLALHPALSGIIRQAQTLDYQAKAEKAQALPSFTFGCFNQTLIGTINPDRPGAAAGAGQRFWGIQAGISVPLWQKPFKARAQAATLQSEALQSQYAQAYSEWQAQILRLDQEIRRLKEGLSYYQNTGLAQAQLLIDQAQKAYSAGEAEYVAYLQALQAAAAIHNAHRQTIYRLNQAHLEAQFLLGE